MARPYTLNRRAQQQADTRQRIVEAAVGLHGEFGPAHTSFSQVAERAGVQRNTLYAHFPDERSLLLACSALSLERDPLPAAAAWRRIGDYDARLRCGLAAVYAWYERNADMAGCVLRDAEIHPLTREIAMLRFGPSMAAYEQVLGVGRGARQRAVLRLALGYGTWKSLVRESKLAPRTAVEVMVRAVAGASAARASAARASEARASEMSRR